jgi:RHS repeat-associated protein
VLDEQHDYTYDNNGNILTSTRDGLTRTYTYDALNRLTQMVKSPVPGEQMPKQITWTFDANSNITQRQETDDNNVVTTYGFTYNDRDWMTQRTINGLNPVTFTYDNNGNLSSDGLGRSFTWNGQDQLTSMTAGGVTTSFLYDPLGRRTRWTQGLTVKNYFYDTLDMLSNGTSLFLNGASIDEPLQVDTSGTVGRYLADHLGSITRVTDNTGVPTAQYAYDPYGSLLTSSTPLAANPFTYTAREDDSTGLLYYRARYYDPQLELFISQDPFGDAQRYVGGNPLIFADPLGFTMLHSFIIYQLFRVILAILP